MSEFAIIFDMDGVIIDNAEYHYRAWEVFCEKEGYGFKRAESKYWFGNTNKEILPKIYEREVTAEELKEKGDYKEKLYRDLIEPDLEPVDGLLELLESFKLAGIPVAMATSAPTENVDFVVDNLGIREYFDHIVDASGVKNGKPSPEIYQKAARLLNIDPSKCLVFEDALAGIASAKEAGMTIVGLITTLEEEELKDTVMNIRDYTEINIKELRFLLGGRNEQEQ